MVRPLIVKPVAGTQSHELHPARWIDPGLERDEDGAELCPFCSRPVQHDPRRCDYCREPL